jgi:threonylcarbamoyladenosine tRNA methylthiotransferase MtaB
MKRVALHTIGCKLNYSETATIGKQFLTSGYSIVGIDEPADLVVINSCSVTSHAERECRHAVRKALRISPGAFVAVVGCYAQIQSEKISELKGVDLVLGVNEKFSILNFIGNCKKREKPDIYVSCVDVQSSYDAASSVGFKDRTRAFIKVQDGCDYSCTYCIVPLARGKSRSAELKTIVCQALEAVELGYKEIVLTGVNVGSYGGNNDSNLLKLLKQLVTIDGLKRIRISSIEPNLLNDELLDLWFTEKKLCNHWHIPIQSGSDTILRQMKRRYLTELYRNRVEKIKNNVPSAGIGADVIVGFPGEAEELFNETYEFLKAIPISYLHVFSYSERPNTPAAQYALKVDPKIKGERSNALHQLSTQKRRTFYEYFIGKTVPVLFESMRPDGTSSGLTEEYVRVDVKSDIDLTNRIIEVKIEEMLDDRCLGKIAEFHTAPAIKVAI